MNDELSPDESAQMYADAGHLDHLSQFCLTTPSFRREINETLVDARGYPDIVQVITDFLVMLKDNDTEKMHQVDYNNTEWRHAERDIFKKVMLISLKTKFLLLNFT